MSKKPLSSDDLKPTQPLEDQTEALHEKIEALGAQLEDAQAQLVRTLAAHDNAEKRMKKQVQDAHAYALNGFCKDLLPVIDSLEKACESAQESDAATQEGLTLTLELLTKTIEKHGVEKIHPLDAPFDPTWHEAVATHADQAKADQSVLEVMQPGYRLKDRLLRPALVVVNRH